MIAAPVSVVALSVQVSYSTSIEFPSDHDQFPHLFSVVPSDHYFAVGVARLISYYNWQRTVVITQDSNHFKRVSCSMLNKSIG